MDEQGRRYRLKPDSFQDVDAWLALFRRFWSARVDALDRHLDCMEQININEKEDKEKKMTYRDEYAPVHAGTQMRNDGARSASGSPSEEVPWSWNKWVRQIHRWLSIAITVGVIVNAVAVKMGKYTGWVGLLALLPFALLLFTGLYLFVLPYATKWRRGRWHTT